MSGKTHLLFIIAGSGSDAILYILLQFIQIYHSMF